METTVLQPTAATDSSSPKKTKKRFETVREFQQWVGRQDFGYEFVKGKVVKKEMIKNVELAVIWWLTEIFSQTQASSKGARLVTEVGILLPNENFRIPDVSYFTREQCFAAAKGDNLIPALAIEILLKSETVQHITEKIKDYFDSGVKVVWYIHPQNETVHVYTSTKNIVICEGDDIVSAKPAIDDFEFPASAIFNGEQN